MKVLVFTERLKLGGGEVMAVELANGLALLDGVEVFFAAAGGVLRERIVSQVEYRSISQFSFSKLHTIGYELKKVISEVKPDVIHSQGMALGVLAGFIARRINKNIKIVITHHSRRFSRLPVSVSIFLFKKYCDFFIAISRDKFQSLIKDGIPRERVALIPNFVDFGCIKNAVAGLKREDVLSDMGISSDSKVISMTGRLIPTKRFDKFIRILAECAQKTDEKVVGVIMGSVKVLKGAYLLINIYDILQNRFPTK